MLYKIKNSNGNALKIIMPSLIGIGVFVTCLLGTTLAWFTDNDYISIQSIESATYGLDITIDSKEGTVNDNGDDVYTFGDLEYGKGYEVSIKAIGTASTGYCLINDNIITEQIIPGETFIFTLYPDANNKEYTFTSIWGTPSDYSGSIKIKNGDIVGTPLVENNIEDVDNTTNNNLNNNINNNLSKPNTGSGTSQPEEIETTIPSEKPEIEEDDKIDNSDTIVDSTEKPSEETEVEEDKEMDSSDEILDSTEKPSEETETEIETDKDIEKGTNTNNEVNSTN